MRSTASAIQIGHESVHPSLVNIEHGAAIEGGITGFTLHHAFNALVHGFDMSVEREIAREALWTLITMEKQVRSAIILGETLGPHVSLLMIFHDFLQIGPIVALLTYVLLYTFVGHEMALKQVLRRVVLAALVALKRNVLAFLGLRPFDAILEMLIELIRIVLERDLFETLGTMDHRVIGMEMPNVSRKVFGVVAHLVALLALKHPPRVGGLHVGAPIGIIFEHLLAIRADVLLFGVLDFPVLLFRTHQVIDGRGQEGRALVVLVVVVKHQMIISEEMLIALLAMEIAQLVIEGLVSKHQDVTVEIETANGAFMTPGHALYVFGVLKMILETHGHIRMGGLQVLGQIGETVVEGIAMFARESPFVFSQSGAMITVAVAAVEIFIAMVTGPAFSRTSLS